MKSDWRNHETHEPHEKRGTKDYRALALGLRIPNRLSQRVAYLESITERIALLDGMKRWRLGLFLFCLAAVLTQPHFTSHYYEWMLQHGAYRPEADSIAIPVAANLVTWIVWAPVFSVGLFFVFRKLKAPYRFFVWDEERKWRSWLISLGCFIPMVLLAYEAMRALPWKNYVEVAYSIWWIAVWLLIRAALLTKRESNPKRSTSP